MGEAAMRGRERLLGREGGRTDRGLYTLWLLLPSSMRIAVGRLGEVEFPAGIYSYVGSAQRNRTARVRRHLRVAKPQRWHIDSLRPYARVLGVTLIDGNRADECRLVRRLLRSLPARIAHPQFGSSDCRCGGHLLHVPKAPLGALLGRIDWPDPLVKTRLLW